MKIYYYSPEGENPPPGGIPSGGPQKLYRHVEILSQAGYDAFVLHDNHGFRYGWFDSTAKVTDIGSVSIEPDDIIVLSGESGPDAGELVRGARKVIFNQGAYLTFNRFSYDPADLRAPYLSDEVIATMVVSPDSEKYLHYAFGDIPIYRIRNSVDTDIFRFVPLDEKENFIAFMPRKNEGDLLQVINILKFRGLLKNYRPLPLDAMSQQEVAANMAKTKIFITAGRNEGFGLPPAEAMASGCAVVGYDGLGGAEFVNESFAFPVPASGIIKFAQRVESLILDIEKNIEPVAEKCKRGSEFIATNFSVENEKNDLLAAWEKIING